MTIDIEALACRAATNPAHHAELIEACGKIVGRQIRNLKPKFGRKLEQYRDDLTQAGAIGVIDALRRYDAGNDACFATWATWWVRHHVQEAAYSLCSGIPIPRASAQRGYRKDNPQVLTALYGVSGSDGLNLGEDPSDPTEVAERREIAGRVREAVRALPRACRAAVEARSLGESGPVSLAEAGRKLSRTGERVRQLEAVAFGYLRKSLAQLAS